MSASSMPTREAVGGERQREVGGGGGFADAAFARGDRDDGAARRARGFAAAAAAARPGGCARPARPAAPRGASAVRTAVDREHAGQRLDRLLRGLAQRLEPRPALALDLDREGDMAVAHVHARDHAERDDILPVSGSLTRLSAARTSSLGDSPMLLLCP